MSITIAQIRGARGILDWSQGDLSERTGISSTSIGAIENGQSTPRASTLAVIKKTLESAGIEFLDNDGIRTKNPYVSVLKGYEGFQKYSLDMYETLKEDKREILQAYVDDKKFADWLKEEAYPHVKRMETIKGLSFKILTKEGDTYFPAKNYAEYRWIPTAQFLSVPFVVYGNKLAIILFDPEPTIIVIDYTIVADVYRLQFHNIWENALIPAKSLIDNSEIPEKYLGKVV